MKKELMNLFMFLGICIVAYIGFRSLNYNLNFKEGLTTDSSNLSTNAADGIAGNAAAYAATIKAETVKLQDTFLISKYRKDYENIILNLDDFINNLMLKTALTVDKNTPQPTLSKLSELNQAKVALNNVMKFVDAAN
jgi:hypothetical protein